MFNIANYFATLNVLDVGSIALIDGMVCDPKLKIVNSARVSFNKESQELTEKDIKLINFLYQHEHYSTFRHSYFSFRIKAPLSTFRQWWKYQVGSEWVENENVGSIQIPETNWNEASGRYVEFEPEFYIPSEIRVQSKDNKQGSSGKLVALPQGEDPVEYFRQACLEQYIKYKYMIGAGAAKEQCRYLLPQNIYSQCIWTCSLQTLIYFFHQRLKSDAQFEIREYARATFTLMKPILAPIEGILKIKLEEQNGKL